MGDLKSLDLTSAEYPPPYLKAPCQELELLVEDLETLDLTSPEYPTLQNWNFLWRTLCGGLVCRDYRCILQGYGLVVGVLPNLCRGW